MILPSFQVCAILLGMLTDSEELEGITKKDILLGLFFENNS